MYHITLDDIQELFNCKDSFQNFCELQGVECFEPTPMEINKASVDQIYTYILYTCLFQHNKTTMIVSADRNRSKLQREYIKAIIGKMRLMYRDTIRIDNEHCMTFTTGSKIFFAHGEHSTRGYTINTLYLNGELSNELKVNALPCIHASKGVVFE